MSRLSSTRSSAWLRGRRWRRKIEVSVCANPVATSRLAATRRRIPWTEVARRSWRGGTTSIAEGREELRGIGIEVLEVDSASGSAGGRGAGRGMCSREDWGRLQRARGRAVAAAGCPRTIDVIRAEDEGLEGCCAETKSLDVAVGVKMAFGEAEKSTVLASRPKWPSAGLPLPVQDSSPTASHSHTKLPSQPPLLPSPLPSSFPRPGSSTPTRPIRTRPFPPP